MTPATARLAAIGIAIAGMVLASATSARADPGADATASARNLDDTASPALYGPGLDRTFRSAAQRADKSEGRAAATALQINLVFHVLSSAGGEGNLSDATLQAQVDVLNATYQPTGLHFEIAEVRRYPDSPYFAGGCFPTTTEGIRMKTELATDPARFVNVYTCKLALPFIAGYGTLPNEFPESDRRHGVVIDYGAVVGGAAPLDLGHTLVHELGHYFGLLHTFQGGCAEPGDDVADTAAEAAPAYGCAVGRDTCPQAGTDPVHNFMDYSDDACTDHFTPQQGLRMTTLIGAFRPGLIGGAFAIGPGMTGNWYSPAQSGHGFSIEILPNQQMLAQWYVFAPEGGQAWIVATGPISGDTAQLQAYREVGDGARFPPAFDPGKLQAQFWGTLTFRFSDCNSGQANWQPALPGYQSGSLAITRLTMPAGLACP
jgi:hypothetical protein